MATLSPIWLFLATLPVLLLLAYQNLDRAYPAPTVDRSKIAVVFAGIAHVSHLEKLEPLAAGAIKAGYHVTFITNEQFRPLAISTGAHFEPIDGPYGAATDEEMADFMANPGDGESKLAINIFIDHMHEMAATVDRVLRDLYKRYDKVVYIHDIGFLGLLPAQLGAPGILPNAIMGLGVTPLTLDSQDTFPFQATSPPDTSENARAIHRQAYHEITNGVWMKLNSALQTKLKDMGAIAPYPTFYHSFGGNDEYILQLGLPEFEYNRTDLVPKIRYLGPPKQTGSSRELPPWWPKLLEAKKAGKKIVVVSQGSAAFDLSNLIIPSLKVLADREDLLVVATTVIAEPEDVPGLEIPKNALVSRWVPFDRLLPQADLIIAAGGYGTVLQAIGAGVPMVLAGLLQDKAHLGTLSEHVGIAVNLKTDAPSAESIRAGVAKILGDGRGQGADLSYKNKIERLQQLSTKYDPIKIMDETILEAVAKSFR